MTANNYFDWSAAGVEVPLPLASVRFPAPKTMTTMTAPQRAHQTGSAAGRPGRPEDRFPGEVQGASPLNVDVKRDYAEYHSVYKFEGRQFSSHRTLKIAMAKIPHDRSEDFAAFRRVIKADEAQQVTLTNQSPGSGSTVGENESAKDLVLSAAQAIQNQRFQTAVELLQRAAKLDPKNKDVWYNLGNAYMGLGQTDHAIDAYRKQIENNAYDAFA